MLEFFSLGQILVDFVLSDRLAVDLDDSKLEFAKQFGATHTVNASKVDPIETIIEMTDGGVDYAFDAIGLRITNEQILPVTRSGGSGAENIGGTAVLIGMPSAASACDFHLAYGFAGYERLNPYAEAAEGRDELAKAIREANAERRARSEEVARSKGPRKVAAKAATA